MSDLAKRILQVTVALLLVSCGVGLLARYPGEWRLSAASATIDAALRGRLDRSQVVERVADAFAKVDAATWQLPHDPRRELVASTALMMLARHQEALTRLSAWVERAERPELVVALGRAYAGAGDEASARAAFLRAAWVAPASIATLPKALREDINRQVLARENELREGRLSMPPPLPMRSGGSNTR
jgi:predicted Zn-dependent protease